MTMISSLIWSAVERSWVIYSWEIPSSFFRRTITSSTVTRKDASIMETGSSAISSFGLSSSALATSIR